MLLDFSTSDRQRSARHGKRMESETVSQVISLAVGLAFLCAPGCKTGPPREKGNFRKPEFVELIKLDSSLKLDIRYATADNFLGRPVYPEARAFLQRPAAAALIRAHRKLQQQGCGLIIFDAYRPWSVTKLFWDETPPEKRQFVANPKKGSMHNRGCAVDVSLFDLRTGEEVAMPSSYDEFSERAHPDYQGGTEESRRLRDLLRQIMEAEGFEVYEFEWWHFNYQDWPYYPVFNLQFSEINVTSIDR